MSVRVILLTCLFAVTYSQYFNCITIKTYRDNVPVTVLKADRIENKNVTEIVIEEEEVPVLKKGSFSDLPRLKYLYIIRSGVKEVEKLAFDNLPKLRIVNLNFNRITHLTRDVFINLPLSIIRLKGNGIESLEPRTFCNLTYLHTLDLSSNNIQELPVGLFYLTSNLKELDLSFNKLVTPYGKVPYNYFLHAFTNVHRQERSVLDLSHNNYTSIGRFYFLGLRGLTCLLLNNNMLKTIDSHTFQEFQFLEELNLEGNNLQKLDDRMLFPLAEKIKTIKLANNPWSNKFVCGFQNWCSTYNFENTIEQFCNNDEN